MPGMYRLTHNHGCIRKSASVEREQQPGWQLCIFLFGYICTCHVYSCAQGKTSTVHNGFPQYSFSFPRYLLPVCSYRRSPFGRSSVNLYLVPEIHPFLSTPSGQLRSALLLIVSRLELWGMRLSPGIYFSSQTNKA